MTACRSSIRSTLFVTIALGVAVALPALRAAVPESEEPQKKPSATQSPDKTAVKVDPVAIAFFERKIRPALIEHCYQCHSSKSDKLKANLYCDSRESLLAGGDSGPAIVPGKPEISLLVKAIQWTDADMQMPPKTQLPPTVVADFVKWVQMGAPWPAEHQSDEIAQGKPQTERWERLKREHWAWQPIQATQLPAVNDGTWPRSDVDRFVLARLEEKQMKPVADVDRVTLIRRVTFDLTGLPARPVDVVAFVQDKSPDAFEKVVDRLLASPQFGERWGRHWLDVARFGESTGSTRNFPYHHAWRYRDYVIDSFNNDKPYHTFISEQIAGDLMPAGSIAERNDRLVATGFLAMGVKDLNERSGEKFAMDNVDEQIDTFSRSILATTLSCARCHDHKFDPISTAEYYQVAGIFRSTEILAGVQNRRGGGRDYQDQNALHRLQPEGAAVAAAPASAGQRKNRSDALGIELKQLQTQIRKMMAEAGLKADKENANALLKKLAKKDPALARRLAAKRKEIQSLKAAIQKAGTGGAAAESPAPGTALAMGVRDAAAPADCRINIRGEHDDLGDAVPRGYVSLIKVPDAPPISSTDSGRLQLAAWLTSPQNPLTARVMVNRIWHHLFGVGLVRTMDNFGTTGELPSHPQLLDHLARQFIADGWSVKKTIRSLVLSRTYQLASRHDAKNYQIDPGNVLLWKHAQRRLDAEEIRDAILFVGQSLNLSRPTASPVAAMPSQELRENKRGSAFDRSGADHRSVYVPVVRSLLQPMMDTFDFAEPTMVTGDRDVTTVATQALFMMNNAFTIEHSRRLADKLLKDSSIGNDETRIDHAYGWTLGRAASAEERVRGLAYINQFIADVGAAQDARADAWTSLVQALIASSEFRYVQ